MFSIVETIINGLFTPLVCIILAVVIGEIFYTMNIGCILEAVLGIVGLILSIKLCCNKIYKGFCIVMCLCLLLHAFINFNWEDHSSSANYNGYHNYNDYEDDNYSNYDYEDTDYGYDYEIDDNYSNYDYEDTDYGYDYEIDDNYSNYDYEDADYGYEIEEAPDLCFKCGGSGNCAVCHGMGYTTFLGEKPTCRSCNGTGTCNRCNGSGYE